MQKNLQDYVYGLGYKFELSLQKQPNTWHYVEHEGFKGAYIFKEIKFADGMSVWLTIYDYKKAEGYSQRFDSRTLSEDELRQVEKARKLLDEKLEKQKLQVNEECRKYCLGEWEKHSFTTSHPYLERKQVVVRPDLFKKRTSELDGSEELLCPMQDASGKFWGYQIISDRRGKDFNIGQRTEGIFVPILLTDRPSRIYIAEGVATALSVCMGLGGEHSVVAALSAGNIPKVVKSLRKRYPKTPFIIMADNDQWSESGNAGKKYAELAAQETDGVVVCLPEFPRDAANKPTDWNDYQQIHGVLALSEVIHAIKPLRPEYFWSLGHNKGTYYFTNLRAPEIHVTKDFSPIDLIKILSIRKWKQLYPEHVANNGKLDWEGIKSELVDMAQKQGHFRVENSRGHGIYVEKGKSLVHLGDRVYFDGQEIELQDFESENFYDLKFRRELPERPANFDMEKFAKGLRAILGGYTWENPLSPELIMGWIYCAYASGGLQWRPHLLVSARAGAGKSTLASLVVEELLKYSGYVKKEDATEAGVRQELENNSVPLIHDEFDTNKGEHKRLSSVLNLLRAASSGGSISRGTPSGKALRFEARFSAYLTGINPPNLNEADQTRITVLRLLKQNPRPWSELEKEILTRVDSEAARAVFWQVVDTLPNMLESAKVIQKCLAGHGERVGQQYGALLAGFWHLFHVEQISCSTAQEYVKRLEGAKTETLAVDDNAERCLDWLLQLTLRVQSADGTHELTVGQILDADSTDGSDSVYARELALAGIKRLGAQEIFVAGQSARLEGHFERTQWQNYIEALLRLPGAERTRLRVGGRNVRGVRLSIMNT